MRGLIIKALETMLYWLRPEENVAPVIRHEFVPQVKIIEVERIDGIVCVEADAIENEFRELIRGLDLDEQGQFLN